MKKISIALCTFILVFGILRNVYAIEQQESDSTLFFELEFQLGALLLEDPDSAFELTQLQDGIIANVPSSRMHSRLHTNYGAYYWITGKLDLALEHFIVALKHAEEGNLKHLVGAQFNNIAIIYNDLEDYERCLEYNLKSLGIGKERKLKRDQLISYNNLGSVYFKIDSLDLAWSYLDSCLELCQSEENKNVQALALGIKGAILNKNGDYDRSLEFSMQSFELSDAIQDTKAKIHASIEIARSYLNLELLKEAEIYFEEAIQLSWEINFLEGLQEGFLLKSKWYAAMGNELQELNYFQKYTSIRDSIFNKKTAQQIALIERKNQQEKEQRLLAEKELELSHLENTKERNQWIFGVSMLGGIFVLIGLFLLYHHYKHIANRRFKDLIVARLKKKLLEKELNLSMIKNDELSESLRKKELELLEYTLTLEKKQQLVHSIQEQIKRLDTRSTEVQRLQRMLKAEQTTSSDWDEFILRFERVHEQFFKKLHSYAEKLTPTDLKICAFLRMNLNSKQIANLLNVESSSVDMARYRLRKNLNLSKEENLTAFINQI